MSAQQPINDIPPPADSAVDAVEEEQEEEADPIVDPENDDGYEADDEGHAGWPQDPFVDEDNMSVITDEGDGN